GLRDPVVRPSEQRGDHLLGRGLAVAAADRDDRKGEPPAEKGREPPERAERVISDDASPPELGRQRRESRPTGRDERERSARAEHVGGPLLTIEIVLLERHEELIGRGRPGADVDAGYHSFVERGRLASATACVDDL